MSDFGERLLIADFGARAVLLDLTTGHVLQLNRTARMIAEALRDGSPVAALAERLGIDTAQAEADVARFTAFLADDAVRRAGVPIDVRSIDGGFALWCDETEVARLERTGRLEVLGGDAAQVRLWATPHVAMLRGQAVLHASAAAPDGRALLFVGETGAGKTTLARALGSVAEDLAFVDPARLVLHAEAERKARAAAERGAPWSPPAGETLPIDAVAFLAPRGPVRAEPLEPVAAMTTHLKNAFAETPDAQVWRLAFDTAQALARGLPHFSLSVPEGLDRLAAIASEIPALLRRR